MRRSAFTIVELLVVIGIIALLVSILLPILGKAKELANRAKCASNERQLLQAMMMYSQDDPDGVLLDWSAAHQGDNFAPLYPKYLSNMQAAVCPSTRNRVRNIDDLMDNAYGAEDDTGGHSYEGRSVMWPGTWPDGRVVYADPKRPDIPGPVKTTMNVKRGAQVMLLTDCDDQHIASEINNWPDVTDNHGKAGVNVGFMDGHVEWTPTGKPLLRAFILGYYNPNLPQAIYDRYGVRTNPWTLP